MHAFVLLILSTTLAAFEPPEPLEPDLTGDLVESELDTPLPTGRYDMLPVEISTQYALPCIYPKLQAKLPPPIKHHVRTQIASANLHLGNASIQEALEAPAWMHLLDYSYTSAYKPDDVSIYRQNLGGILALSDSTGSRVAVDTRYNIKNYSFLHESDYIAENVTLDVHMEDSSAKDYKLTGKVHSAFSNTRDPLTDESFAGNSFSGFTRWVRELVSSQQLEVEGSIGYHDITLGETNTENESWLSISTAYVKTWTDWAAIIGGVGRISSLPLVRTRFLPGAELSWRIARRTAISVFAGGSYSSKEPGEELQDRDYARPLSRIAINEQQKAVARIWHNLGDLVLFQFTAGLEKNLFFHNWRASKGYVTPELTGSKRNWLAESQLSLIISNRISLNGSITYRSFFTDEERFLIPDIEARLEFKTQIGTLFSFWINETYQSSVTTGETVIPILPELFLSNAGTEWQVFPHLGLHFEGNNLLNKTWQEIPYRQGEGFVFRTSVLASF